MAFLGKTYKIEKEENYEAYVDSFGFTGEKKADFLIKPTQRFEKDGDNYKHIMKFDGQEITIDFKPGVEFKNDEYKSLNLYTVDGNTITHVFKFIDQPDLFSTIKKEFKGDKMVETYTSSKWDGKATRYYSV